MLTIMVKWTIPGTLTQYQPIERDSGITTGPVSDNCHIRPETRFLVEAWSLLLHILNNTMFSEKKASGSFLSKRKNSQWSMFLLAILCFFLGLLNVVQADLSVRYELDMSAYPVVSAVASIGMGIIFLLFGSKLVKPISFLAGFSLAYVICISVMANLELNHGVDYGSNRDLIILLVPLIVGLLVGGLFLCVLKLGILAIGAMAGFSLAGFVLTWKSSSTIDSGVYRPIFIAIFTISGAFLMLFFEKTFMAVCTSIIGAFWICCGADVFFGAGFKQALKLCLTNTGDFQFNDRTTILLVSFAVLVVFGIFIQLKFLKAPGSHSSK
jgi:hypothetical protein